MMRPGREERIRRRAYEIWEREGRPDGRQAEHWELARTEIEAYERRAATQDVPAARVLGTAQPAAEIAARDPSDRGAQSEAQERRQQAVFATESDPLGRMQGKSDIPDESAMAPDQTASTTPKRRGGGKGRGTRAKKVAAPPPNKTG